MNKLSNFLKITLVLIFCFSTAIKAQEVNLDAVNEYFKITDKIRQGDTLSRSAWADFTGLEGNRIYIANNGFSEAFLESYRKTLNFVYSPKNSEKLGLMMKDKVRNWMAYKINQYKENEAALKTYAHHLSDATYLDNMYENAWKWLPKQLRSKSPGTRIFFIGMDNGALVDDGTIVFSLWTAYNQDRLKEGILSGHEMHHVLRKPIDFKMSPNEEGIFYVLQSILNEGSADMIDKKYSFDTTREIAYEYRFEEFLLTQSDSIINQIDSTFQVMASSNGNNYPTIKSYRQLMNYTSGHNPGYYMADIIVRNGFGRKLVQHIQNPFYFFKLYNKAAKRDAANPHIFSNTSIDYLNSLEKKYWRRSIS